MLNERRCRDWPCEPVRRRPLVARRRLTTGRDWSARHPSPQLTFLGMQASGSVGGRTRWATSAGEGRGVTGKTRVVDVVTYRPTRDAVGSRAVTVLPRLVRTEDGLLRMTGRIVGSPSGRMKLSGPRGGRRPTSAREGSSVLMQRAEARSAATSDGKRQLVSPRGVHKTTRSWTYV